jgi:hypothetical protein
MLVICFEVELIKPRQAWNLRKKQRLANTVDSKCVKAAAPKYHPAPAATKIQATPIGYPKKREPKVFCAVHMPREKRRIWHERRSKILPRLDGCTYKFFTKSCKNAAQFRDTGTWDDEVHAAFHGNPRKGEPTELCAVHLPLNQRKVLHGTRSEILAYVEESYDYQFFSTDSHDMAAQYMDTGIYTLTTLTVSRAVSEESELPELDFSVLAS